LDLGQDGIRMTSVSFTEFIEKVIPGVRCEPVMEQKLIG
jgi:hypothetical protein|tara:strand:- start:3765 stop:3881 length:117 start_codon:yes stop_codon:yes gene_type:complete